MPMFKAKLRKIGNSIGIYIPKEVITSYKVGDVITLNVITSGAESGEEKKNVITSTITSSKNKPITSYTRAYIWCDKHDASTITCGCKG